VTTREEIQRVELQIGTVEATLGQGGAAAASYAGVLGRPEYGPILRWPAGATFSNPTTLPAVAAARLDLKGGIGGAVTAIELAPDCPIAAVDVYLGGFSTSARRHRITAGAPLIGELSAFDFAHVVPVMTLCNLAGLGGDGGGTARASDAWGRQNFVWDATVQDAIVFPIRLNLCRGGARPTYAKRAPLKAFVRFSTKSTNGVSQAGDKFNLWALVDGRSSFDVTAYIDTGPAPTGSPVLDVELVEPTHDSAGNVARYSLLASDPLTAGTPKIKSYTGNPGMLARARISGSECEGYIKIEAWD
jgi:hypothetical protein